VRQDHEHRICTSPSEERALRLLQLRIVGDSETPQSAINQIKLAARGFECCGLFAIVTRANDGARDAKEKPPGRWAACVL
jgi:hypothetical protein